MEGSADERETFGVRRSNCVVRSSFTGVKGDILLLFRSNLDAALNYNEVSASFLEMTTLSSFSYYAMIVMYAV